MHGRSPPRYLWPADHQRNGQPFCDPEPVPMEPYRPEEVGPHAHTEPLCSLCDTHRRLMKLRKAEEAYLLACGWTKETENAWTEPNGRQGRTLSFGHAVNSELRLATPLGVQEVGELLHAAMEYVLAAGWVEEKGVWVEPPGRHDGVRRCHLRRAMNSQKQWDRITLKFRVQE